MKKQIFTAGLALAALGFAGCQNEPAKAPDTEPRAIPVTISASVTDGGETRTIIEGDRQTGFTSAWTLGDKIGFYAFNQAVQYDYRTVNAEFSITSIEDGIGTFDGEIIHDGAARTFDLYAYTPRKADINVMANHTSVEFLSIETTQTMRENDMHDDSSDLMVALPGQQISVLSSGEIISDDLEDLQFRYVVGFMNLTVGDITADGVSADEEVVSVKITGRDAETAPALAANFNLDLTNGDMKSMFGKSDNVTVWLPEGVTLGELSAWACVIPFEADELDFVVTTAANVIRRTATTEQFGGKFSIAAGNVKTFELNVDENCTVEANKPVEFNSANYGVIQNGLYGQGLQNVSLTFRDYDPQAAVREGFQLTMELIAAMDTDPSNEYLDLPEGTYHFNESRAGMSISIDPQYTNVMPFVADRPMGSQAISGGTMVVEGDHTDYTITFDIDYTGGKLKAEYNGAIYIENPGYIPPAQSIDLGELTGVLSLTHKPNIWGAPYNVDGWELAFGNAGTFLEYGNYKGSGWVLQLFLHAPMVAEGQPLPDGEYQIKQSYDPFTGLPGAWGRTDNAWIIHYKFSSIDNELPITEGFITSKFEDGLYNMTVNLKTINGDIVTGTVKADPTVTPMPL
ncbi:MAG: fimbrillin family protein [Alistipes sp.]|jgi:hypothetical protein|nr:fimbrillin family protein [Alistipes sp.]